MREEQKKLGRTAKPFESEKYFTKKEIACPRKA
jgi:hypothetical protein